MRCDTRLKVFKRIHRCDTFFFFFFLKRYNIIFVASDGKRDECVCTNIWLSNPTTIICEHNTLLRFFFFFYCGTISDRSVVMLFGNTTKRRHEHENRVLNGGLGVLAVADQSSLRKKQRFIFRKYIFIQYGSIVSWVLYF